jgi:voltage-gated sodium channel
MQFRGFVKLQTRVSRIVTSLWFKSLMGILIILNLFYIGIESDFKDVDTDCSSSDGIAGNNPSDGIADPAVIVWRIFDNLFASIFVFEIAMRILACGVSFLTSLENIVDLGLVVSGCIDIWLLSASTGCSGSSAGSSVRILTALRVIRIMRVIRFFRLMKSFGQIRLIVSGLMSSLKTLVWVFVFMIVIIYMCSIFTTTQFGPMSNNFSSIPDSMLSLFQITTLDSWSDTIVRPLVLESPAVIVFFLLYIFFTSFGLVNIVLGIVVENTILSANEKKARDMREREVIKQGAISSLRDLLENVMISGSKTISRSDFSLCLQVPDIQEKWKILELPESVTSILYPNDDDLIGVDDLVSICAQVSMSASPAGLIDVLNDLEGLLSAVTSSNEIAQGLVASRESLRVQMNMFGTRCGYYLTGKN